MRTQDERAENEGTGGGGAALAARGWRPSKFIEKKGRWRSATAHVGIGSRLSADRALAAYVDAIRAHARGALADLGCGNAPLAGVYAPYVESMLWVDWPASTHGLVTPDLEQDLAEPLALPDACVDTVLLTDVLEHMREPDRLIGEIRRILRPGGRAIIGVPFLYWLHEEPHDHHRFTIHKLRDFAAAHDFEMVEERVYAGGLDVVRDMLTKTVHSPRLPLAGWAMHALTGLAFAPLVPLSRRMRDVMPMGYLVVFGVR